MKKENRFMLNKAVTILCDTFKFSTKDIMLVGSLALDLQGILPQNHYVHDVDVIIKMDEQTWRILKLIECIYQNANNKKSYKGSDNLSFTYDWVNFNIWKAKDNEQISGLTDKFTGVWVKPAGEILKVKKGYGRQKDLKDICEITKEIL